MSVTIEDVMHLAHAYASEEADGCASVSSSAYDELRAALTALVAQSAAVAAESERHACSIAVWMTLQDALAEGADDKGLEGWMREAEQRVKERR